ncbi:hypothetical protein EHS25_002340 [Saitozyma podzolica]|uniref:Extracellular membrane protein CFEM domain-containing protein n=1 Tax=Saitozyma podzolica TaxID=1890683 RepID=A0A427YDS1_9TREE|nr:hypothetical protein EHS25_002340 [Saitozyma podzolica]
MSSRTTLLALATTALTLSMVTCATPLPADSNSAYIGCFSTSSPLFPGSLDSPDVHVVTRVSALADCVDICSGTPGYSYAFWREKSHTCWCAPETAEILPYIEALDEKGSCEETSAAGVALNQQWQHTGCFAYPSPPGDLITPPPSDSALSPSEQKVDMRKWFKEQKAARRRAV